MTPWKHACLETWRIKIYIFLRKGIVLDEKKLTLTIEQLRQQLCHMVKEKGFADAAVIDLSQKLDIYLVQYQQRHPEGN